MTSALPEDNGSEHVVSTTLCVEEVDKEGHVVRRFCVTVPGPYILSSGTDKEAPANKPPTSD